MPARTSPVFPKLRLVERLPVGEADANAAFLDFVGPLEGLHVLMVGSGQADLMCQLARRGCARVTAMRPACHLHADPADLVIVTVGSAAQAEQAIGLAGRALTPATLLLLRFQADAPAALVRQARRLMDAAGFGAGLTRNLRGGAVIVADQGRRAARRVG